MPKRFIVGRVFVPRSCPRMWVIRTFPRPFPMSSIWRWRWLWLRCCRLWRWFCHALRFGCCLMLSLLLRWSLRVGFLPVTASNISGLHTSKRATWILLITILDDCCLPSSYHYRYFENCSSLLYCRIWRSLHFLRGLLQGFSNLFPIMTIGINVYEGVIIAVLILV